MMTMRMTRSDSHPGEEASRAYAHGWCAVDTRHTTSEVLLWSHGVHIWFTLETPAALSGSPETKQNWSS